MVRLLLLSLLLTSFLLLLAMLLSLLWLLLLIEFRHPPDLGQLQSPTERRDVFLDLYHRHNLFVI